MTTTDTSKQLAAVSEPRARQRSDTTARRRRTDQHPSDAPHVIPFPVEPALKSRPSTDTAGPRIYSLPLRKALRETMEPLLRRALAIDEVSFGSEHPDVARDLNNLAALLQATNRLDEAEPLSRQMVEILLLFTMRTGREHPHSNDVFANYMSLLEAMGHDEAESKVTFEMLIESVKRRMSS